MEELNLARTAKTLEDFKYKYNEGGQLRHTETQEPFKFINQVHYDAIGDQVSAHIQRLMITTFGMEEVFLPMDGPSASVASASPSSASSSCKNNIFLSSVSTCTKLLVIIQGSGCVRAGQWARSLCINDSLLHGSMLPCIQRALGESYGIVVMNPNLNYGLDQSSPSDPSSSSPTSNLALSIANSSPDKKVLPISGSESPEKHCLYVWDHIIAPCAAKHIVILAHSYGGVCTLNLLAQREQQVMSRVRAIALTDSVHSLSHLRPKLSAAASDFLLTHALNFVTSPRPLDTHVSDNREGVRCVSAGHTRHEHTTSSAMNSTFVFFDLLLRKYGTLAVQQQQQQAAAAAAASVPVAVGTVTTVVQGSREGLPQSSEEKLNHAMKLKEEGNKHFAAQSYKDALFSYKQIFLYIDGLPGTSSMAIVDMLTGSGRRGNSNKEQQLTEKARDLRLTANLNLASTYLRLNEFDKVVRHCNTALGIDDKNFKALVRRGLAYLDLGELDKAKSDFFAAEEINHLEPQLLLGQRRLKELLAQHKEKEKKIYGQMFGKGKK